MRQIEAEHAQEPEALAQHTKALLRKLRRSIRSSIAMSRRRGDFHAPEHVANFGETLDWRNEGLGWEIGQNRIKVAARLRADLNEFNDRYLTFAYAAVTVAEHINTRSSSAWRTGNRARIKLDALCELHSQAIVVMEEILAMIEAGLPTGASARWRTLYEIAVIGHFLARSPNDTSERYLASHVPEALRQIDLALSETSRRDAARRKRLVQERITVQAKVDELVGLYGPIICAPYGWAAKRLGQRGARFSDIEARARSSGFKILPSDDRSMYKEASQHIHAERLSSMRTLSKDQSKGSLFVGATLDPSRVQVIAIWTFCNLTWTLGEMVSRTQNTPEALYWSYVVHMYSLDADTEVWGAMHDVNTGYLRTLFALEK